MIASIKPRRKPSQSRARMTSGAIQDAFVIALVERGYERVSMREIASIAGVGLGTLYLYFPNKDSIAAVTINAWVRRLALTIEAALSASRSASLLQRADALVRTLVETTYAQPEQWRALLFLERRLSPPAVYQEGYMHHVHVVADAFAGAPDWPADHEPQPIAFTAFSIGESTLRHALLIHDVPPPMEPLIAGLQHALRGYLAYALAPR